MTNLNTRLLVDNSKLLADLNLSVPISQISNLSRIRFIKNESKNFADNFMSISLSEIKSILNGDSVYGFDSNTRIVIAASKHDADDDFGSSHIDDILNLVITENDYTASAVHFDGATDISIASLTATDGPAIVSVFSFLTPNSETIPTYWVSDAENTYENFITGEDATGVVASLFGDTVNYAATSYPQMEGVWHSLITAIDCSQDPIALVAYLDDVLVGQPPFLDNATELTTIAINGLSFRIGGDTYDDYLVGDLCNFSLRTVNVINGSGEIDEATRRLFFNADNSPVDPAIATAELGAPLIGFFGDAADWVAQAITQGFTINGTLTDAATHP